MNNTIKKAHDIDSIKKHINERQQIINEYIKTRKLDREVAISKIIELRKTDENVAMVTTAKLLQDSIPFFQATDEKIVEELKMQVDILYGELTKKLFEP